MQDPSDLRGSLEENRKPAPRLAGPEPVKRMSVGPVANQMEDMAARIHAVQIEAYRQEASLLGVREFPPLDRTVQDVLASPDAFFGAFDGEELLGVISLEQRSEDEVLISSLTVAPAFQRRGVARALVAGVAGWTRSPRISVATGAKNGPALALYEQLGFVESSRRFVGEEQLEVVELSVERARLTPPSLP